MTEELENIGSVTGYEVLREIGEGAHGSVFLARKGGASAALKICRRPGNPARIVDWEREMRGWRLFSALPPHPGLVRVFDSGVSADGGFFWVAMELADAEGDGRECAPGEYRPATLASRLSAEVALPLRECIAIGERLASALEFLQSRHLLHRDVKPGNVIFVRGEAVIADAGLVVDSREAASLVGTPGYEPPEHHGTTQGDVFSLGRTLWRACSGRSAEEAGCAPCAEADTGDPDFREFLAVVDRAMSVLPGRRYRSAKALRKAIAGVRRARFARLVRNVAIPAVAAACAALAVREWFRLQRQVRELERQRPAAGAPAAAEDDPLDQLREDIRAGRVHIVTPEEGKRIAEEAQKVADDAARQMQSVLDSISKSPPKPSD